MVVAIFAVAQAETSSARNIFLSCQVVAKIFEIKPGQGTFSRSANDKRVLLKIDTDLMQFQERGGNSRGIDSVSGNEIRLWEGGTEGYWTINRITGHYERAGKLPDHWFYLDEGRCVKATETHFSRQAF